MNKKNNCVHSLYEASRKQKKGREYVVMKCYKCDYNKGYYDRPWPEGKKKRDL